MSEIQNDIEEQPKYIEEQPKLKRPKGRPRETEEMKAERRALTRNPDIPPVGRPKWNPDSIHYDVEKARDYHRDNEANDKLLEYSYDRYKSNSDDYFQTILMVDQVTFQL